MNNADDIPQSERRRTMAEERRAKTYMGHSMNADLEFGGRFSKVHTAIVTGSSPGPIYPQQPSTSPWHCDPVPPEPPAGYAIDAMEPVGEVFERGLPSTPAASSGVVGVGGEPSKSSGSATQQPMRMKRRV